jgi:hypothetical protein
MLGGLRIGVKAGRDGDIDMREIAGKDNPDVCTKR